MILHHALSFVGRVVLHAEFWILLGLLWPWREPWRERLRRTALAFLAALTVLPMGEWALHPLEQPCRLADLPEAPAGIIVLGGAEDVRQSRRWSAPEFNDAGERLTTGLALSRIYPQARIVFAGGGWTPAPGQLFETEADISRAFFRASGLEIDRLTVEAASRNTRENALNACRVVRPHEGERWILVTSAFHAPRALAAFRKAGWSGLAACPVDHRSEPFGAGIALDLPAHLEHLNIALKEYAGRLAYAFMPSGARDGATACGGTIDAATAP